MCSRIQEFPSLLTGQTLPRPLRVSSDFKVIGPRRLFTAFLRLWSRFSSHSPPCCQMFNFFFPLPLCFWFFCAGICATSDCLIYFAGGGFPPPLKQFALPFPCFSQRSRPLIEHPLSPTKSKVNFFSNGCPLPPRVSNECAVSNFPRDP